MTIQAGNVITKGGFARGSSSEGRNKGVPGRVTNITNAHLPPPPACCHKNSNKYPAHVTNVVSFNQRSIYCVLRPNNHRATLLNLDTSTPPSPGWDIDQYIHTVSLQSVITDSTTLSCKQLRQREQGDVGQGLIGTGPAGSHGFEKQVTVALGLLITKPN